MKNFFSFGLALIAVGCLLTAPACRQQPQSRQYEENAAADTVASEKPQTQPQAGYWRWEKPRLWSAEGGEGLRLATFFVPGRDGSCRCTLVALPGNGGGVQANVQRWLGQLQLPLFSPPQLADFLSRQNKIQTRDGLPVTVIDFTTLGRLQEQQVPSMLVAIVAGDNETLFIKLSGGKALLEKNREDFLKFCQSLSRAA